MTNPLITEARRLDAARTGQRTAVGFTSAHFATHWYTDTAEFIAFAANNILAFADKIEELQEALRTMAKGMAGYESRIYELEDENSGFGTKIEEQEKEIAQLREECERRTRLCSECGKGFLDEDWAIEREELEKQVATLTQQNADLKEAYEALKNLIERLDAVHEDPQYKGVWTLHHVHGGRYTGLTYTKALEQARKALEASK